MKYEKSCGAVVYRFQNNQLFFLVEHMRLGHTSIPKGHVEGNETEAETAIREIREETNLEVRLDTVFRHEICYSPAKDTEKQVIFFAAEAVTGNMKNQECEVSALEWLPYEQAIRAVTYDSDKDVLNHAAVYLGAKHSFLIKDTTREERERIVAESIGNISGLCDGCSPGIVEMYQEYIDGKKELREINAEFRAGYMSGAFAPERSDCDYAG